MNNRSACITVFHVNFIPHLYFLFPFLRALNLTLRRCVSRTPHNIRANASLIWRQLGFMTRISSALLIHQVAQNEKQ